MRDGACITVNCRLGSGFARWVEVVDFMLEVPYGGCEKLRMELLRPLLGGEDWDFRSSPVRPPFDAFLKLLVCCLDAGMNCVRFHGLKHREVFFIMNVRMFPN